MIHCFDFLALPTGKIVPQIQENHRLNSSICGLPESAGRMIQRFPKFVTRLRRAELRTWKNGHTFSSTALQQFRDLHGVQRSALEELIARDPKREAVVERTVLAETADLAIVALGDV